MAKIHETIDALRSTDRPHGHIAARVVSHDENGDAVDHGYVWSPASLPDSIANDVSDQVGQSCALVQVALGRR